MKKSQVRKPCYYCGTPIGQTGSKEHVPPQMMFPKGTDKITVPSCRKHNQDKSDRDAAIISLLIRSAIVEWHGRRNIAPDILEAMNMVQKTINELKAKYPDKPLLSSLPEFLQDLPEFPYVPVGVDVQGWIKQLTAGLVYNAVDGFDQSIEWDEVFVMSPDMLETNTPPFSEQELQEQLKRLQVKQAEVQRLNSYFWFDGWKSGPNPYPANIYHFQVSFLPDFVYLKHRFYNTFNWYVPFRPLPNTIRKLKEKIGITA